MLVFRKEQVAAFRRDDQQRFIERIRATITAKYPAHHEAMGDAGTERLIRMGIEVAERHGIDTQGATAELIELMVEFGERLERSPDRAWAEGILAQPELPGQVKVLAIREYLSAATGGRPLVVLSG